MFEQLAALSDELDRLEADLPGIYAAGDRRASRDAGRRHQELKPVVEAYGEWKTALQDVADTREVLESQTDPAERDTWRKELSDKEAQLKGLEARIKELLLPHDPNEGRNVIVELQGPEGGEEANLWAGDLDRMYQRFAERHGLKTEVLSSQPSEHGGYRDITFLVKGGDAWSLLKYEGGRHRVERVPATESQGRVHTSAATVAVLPEAEDIDVEIDPNDLEIDVFRATGPGGQSVNTTDSAVRITHKPTGLVVSCQDEKSQLQNKDKAMRILRSRLLQADQDRQHAEVSAARRDQVKGGGRSEKTPPDNHKENRLTDHRIPITLHALDRVLEGELDDVVGALAAAERSRQLGGARHPPGYAGSPQPARDAFGR